MLNPYTLSNIANLFLVFLLFSAPLWSLLTLWHLRRRRRSASSLHSLEGTPLVLWVLVILLVPYFGAIAYFVVDPVPRAGQTT